MEEREVLTWEQFGLATRELAEAVAGGGFVPDMVLRGGGGGLRPAGGVVVGAGGGLFPAGAVAYALGVKNVFTMNVEFYTGVDQRLEMPVVLPPVLDVVDINGSRVLVVDDVADTGATLKLVTDFCADHVAEVR